MEGDSVQIRMLPDTWEVPTALWFHRAAEYVAVQHDELQSHFLSMFCQTAWRLNAFLSNFPTNTHSKAEKVSFWVPSRHALYGSRVKGLIGRCCCRVFTAFMKLGPAVRSETTTYRHLWSTLISTLYPLCLISTLTQVGNNSIEIRSNPCFWSLV